MNDKLVLRLTVAQIRGALTKELESVDKMERIVRVLRNENQQNFIDWEHEKALRIGERYDSEQS